jgi:hypothetical protein
MHAAALLAVGCCLEQLLLSSSTTDFSHALFMQVLSSHGSLIHSESDNGNDRWVVTSGLVPAGHHGHNSTRAIPYQDGGSIPVLAI